MRKRFLLSALAAFGFAYLCILLTAKGYGDGLDNWLLGRLYELRGPKSAPESVAVVRIDQESYRARNLDRWTGYPYELMGEAVERIGEAGAEMVLLDVFFLKDADDANTKKLKTALSKTPSVLVHAVSMTVDVDIEGNKERHRHPLVSASGFVDAASMNISAIVNNHLGSVQRISLGYSTGADSEMAVPLLKPLRKFMNKTLPQPGRFDLINFYGGPSTLASFSIEEVLQADKRTLRDKLNGKAIFLGYMDPTKPYGHDTFYTGYPSEYPTWGVEIHATIAANLLEGSYLKQYNPQKSAILFGVLMYGVAFSVFNSGATVAFSVLATAAALCLLVLYLAFSQFLVVLPLAGMLQTFVGVFLGRLFLAANAPQQKPRETTQGDANLGHELASS